MLYASPALEANQAAKVAVAALYLETPISHDVIFHSLLRIAGILTPVYRPELNIFSGRLLPSSDPYVSLPPLEPFGTLEHGVTRLCGRRLALPAPCGNINFLTTL